MTDPRQPFLRAIERDFDDDTPRLVFADWLDEHGDTDRAEFIRLQCEAARLEQRVWWDDEPHEQTHRERLEQEADALLAVNRRAWTKGLRWWAWGRSFARGFLECWHLTAKDIVKHGAALRALTPVGGMIYLNRLNGWEAAAFRSDHLVAVTGLQIDAGGLTDAGVQHLASGSHLGRLQRLYLGRDSRPAILRLNHLTDSAARSLAASDCLHALTDLKLGNYPDITSAGVRAILESAKRAGLTLLSVSGPEAGPALAAVFRSPDLRVTGLKSLDIGGRAIGDTGARMLADSPSLAALTELGVSGNELTDDAVEALLASAQLRGLQDLWMANNPEVTDRSARAVLADPRRWSHVCFEGTRVSNDMRNEIAARCEANR